MTIITPLYIDTTYPKLYIDRQLPKVYIDQSQCFYESGLKGPVELSEEAAAEGYKASLQGIKRRVSEGSRMEAIENSMQNAIPEIAFQNSFDIKEFNLVSMPRSRPKIDVEGYLNIEWEEGRVDFSKESVLEYKYRLRQGENIDIKL